MRPGHRFQNIWSVCPFELTAVEHNLYTLVLFTGTFVFLPSNCPTFKNHDVGSQILCPVLTGCQALRCGHTGESSQNHPSAGGGKETLLLLLESAFWLTGFVPSHVKHLEKCTWLWETSVPDWRDACLSQGHWVAQARFKSERWMVLYFVVLTVGGQDFLRRRVERTNQTEHRMLPLGESKPNCLWLRLESPAMSSCHCL